MASTLTNFWYIAFDDNTIKFFDDERQVTMEEWKRRAAPHEVERLERDLAKFPELVPAVPPHA
jgi:hypothetical protein